MPVQGQLTSLNPNAIKIMKSLNKLVLAATILGSIAFASTALADDSWLAMSPKVRANRQMFSVQMSNDPDLIHTRSAKVGSPKVQAFWLAMATVPARSTMKDPDLIREQRAVLYTGKNPFKDMEGQHFEIAPLK
jgi:hypothetical protein